jgi:acyl carrier protein
MIELIMDLEKESGVDISNDTVAEVRTVEDVVRYVRLRPRDAYIEVET